MLKKIIRKILKIISVFVLCVLSYLGIEYILSSTTVNAEKTGEQQSISIYILTNGVHTDIVMPVNYDTFNWSQVFPFADTRSGDSSMNYLAVGWGDRGFYMETPEWKDLKFSVAFKAVFGLGKTALHTTYYRHMILSEDCVEIKISPAQYKRLIQYILNSLDTFEATHHAKVITTDAQYGAHDAFYEANGSYSLFTTCNTWSNKALRKSGLKSAVWVAFKRGIFYQYRE